MTWSAAVRTLKRMKGGAMLTHATYHDARRQGPTRRPKSARRITLAARAAQRNHRRNVQRSR